MNPALTSVSYAREQQRRDELEAAVADWRSSTGPQHARDRRWATALIEVARARRNLRRAEVQAAVNRNTVRRAA